MNEKSTPSLLKCKVCGHVVSSRANICPNCGDPNPAGTDEKKKESLQDKLNDLKEKIKKVPSDSYEQRYLASEIEKIKYAINHGNSLERQEDQQLSDNIRIKTSEDNVLTRNRGCGDILLYTPLIFIIIILIGFILYFASF